MPNSMPPSRYARLVRDMRKTKKLSQRQVASDAGLSPGYVAMVETGTRSTRPKRESVLRMGRGLQATPSEQSALLRAAGFIEIEGISPAELAAITHTGIAEAGITSDPTLRDDHRKLLLAILKGLRVRAH